MEREGITKGFQEISGKFWLNVVLQRLAWKPIRVPWVEKLENFSPFSKVSFSEAIDAGARMEWEEERMRRWTDVR